MSSTEDRGISPAAEPGTSAAPFDGPSAGATAGESSSESPVSAAAGAPEPTEDAPSPAVDQEGSVAPIGEAERPVAAPAAPGGPPPSFVFFGVVAAVSLVADVATKA